MNFHGRKEPTSLITLGQRKLHAQKRKSAVTLYKDRRKTGSNRDLPAPYETVTHASVRDDWDTGAHKSDPGQGLCCQDNQVMES